MEEIIFIEEINFEKARKKIRQNQDKGIIFSSDDDDLNRKILEKEKIKILLISQKGKNDFAKQRNSGFNHVLAKLAKKSGVIIGINLDEIVDSKGKEKAEILARVIQNIKICNKNKLKMKFIFPSGKFKRDLYDLRSLGLTLGMPTWMVKEL